MSFKFYLMNQGTERKPREPGGKETEVETQGRARKQKKRQKKKNHVESKTTENRHHHRHRSFISRTGATEYKTRRLKPREKHQWTKTQRREPALAIILIVFSNQLSFFYLFPLCLLLHFNSHCPVQLNFNSLNTVATRVN